jgi:hypothetical protein
MCEAADVRFVPVRHYRSSHVARLQTVPRAAVERGTPSLVSATPESTALGEVSAPSDILSVMLNGERADLIVRARAALIMAAMRRSLVLYAELGTAIGMDESTKRAELRHVLDELALDCIDRGEPPLAALVVNAKSGSAGAGWSDGSDAWHEQLHSVFVCWAPNQ